MADAVQAVSTQVLDMLLSQAAALQHVLAQAIFWSSISALLHAYVTAPTPKISSEAALDDASTAPSLQSLMSTDVPLMAAARTAPAQQSRDVLRAWRSDAASTILNWQPFAAALRQGSKASGAGTNEARPGAGTNEARPGAGTNEARPGAGTSEARCCLAPGLLLLTALQCTNVARAAHAAHAAPPPCGPSPRHP